MSVELIPWDSPQRSILRSKEVQVLRRFQSGRLRLLGGVLALCLFVAPAFADVAYTVKSGDTLSKLAQRFAVPLRDLIEVNHISNPNRIAVGQVLQIPGKTPIVADVTPAVERPALASRATNPREIAEGRAQLIAEQGNQLVKEARSFLGTPYRWGGLGSRGIDCSGLVLRSMQAMGKSLPRSSADMFRVGNRVSYGELQPGDLVFFNTNGRGVSHVGIWAGDHHFIHASTKQGVTISRIDGYYSKRLVGARRVLK